jgi:ABC-2 type transport system ATP-binding protein
MTHVHGVRRDGASLEILASDAEHVARELLMRDDGLSGLEISGAGLEDAFLALTSGKSAGIATADSDLIAAGGVR